ncbi:MAG: sulfite exporter TauE/SafE family protein [Paracoccaceae bacterium]
MLDIALDLNVMAFSILFLAFAFGGILKGATGAGTPVVAIPILAIFFDVQLAVILMVVPNLVSNSVQIVQYRNAQISKKFVTRFAAFGVIGCLSGTVILAVAPPDILEIIVAISTASYIALRIMKPELQLKETAAQKLSILIGFLGGVFQGSSGMASPIALSFLTAMKINRAAFIFTISSFFGAMAVAQIIMLLVFDLLSWPVIIISATAFIPQIMFMPIGNLITKNMSKTGFDIVILGLLSTLCVKLIFNIIYG